jgi:hypothetical protein
VCATGYASFEVRVDLTNQWRSGDVLARFRTEVRPVPETVKSRLTLLTYDLRVACNLHKGSNLSGLEPETGTLTPLFHPRRHAWDEHFELKGNEILGRTAIGRTTVQVLRLNDSVHIRLRIAAWM